MLLQVCNLGAFGSATYYLGLVRGVADFSETHPGWPTLYASVERNVRWIKLTHKFTYFRILRVIRQLPFSRVDTVIFFAVLYGKTTAMDEIVARRRDIFSATLVGK